MFSIYKLKWFRWEIRKRTSSYKSVLRILTSGSCMEIFNQRLILSFFSIFLVVQIGAATTDYLSYSLIWQIIPLLIDWLKKVNKLFKTSTNCVKWSSEFHIALDDHKTQILFV